MFNCCFNHNKKNRMNTQFPLKNLSPLLKDNVSSPLKEHTLYLKKVSYKKLVIF